MDDDIEILSETIPQSSSNLLISKNKIVKKEKEVIPVASVTETHSHNRPIESTTVNINNNVTLSDNTNDLSIVELYQSRKGFNDPKVLGNDSVNMQELLKFSDFSTKQEFYSCISCSSKFTTVECYNFHMNRQIGEFSYNCDLCKKTLKQSNLCQINLHMLSEHKQALMNVGKLTFKSLLTAGISESTREKLDEICKTNIKKISESQIDLVKDQKQLLVLAKGDLVHKFYSDHYRAANHTLIDQPVELLHCFMCNFTCQFPAQLISHLNGDQITKCAFCSLSLPPVNKENFCAAKAHVLLHMGIFIMCPRCGFVPSPDLNPVQFEICLRLHLRFVCFHFHSTQIYICGYCNRANNTSVQSVHHIYDEHLSLAISCSICSDSQIYSNVTIKSHHTSAHPNIDFDIYRNNNTIASSSKQCNHCSDVILQKDLYYSHLNSQHKSQMIKGTSAYRCFGSCKRIHHSVDEFIKHKSECTQANSSIAKLFQTQSTDVHRNASSLCFCLYCGIGGKKKKSNAISNGCPNGDDSRSNESSTNEQLMFTDLHEVHQHEQSHILQDINQTACPWCSLKLTAKVGEMTGHMATHLPDNWFLSWYKNRSDRFLQNPNDLMNCYCDASIDTPVSLHCHSIPAIIPVTSALPASSSAPLVGNTRRHLSLTEAIYREFTTNPRHKVAGLCPLCKSLPATALADTILTNTMDMSWHIFIKHRVTLCYVCKNYQIINGDNTSACRVRMWSHIHQCLRRFSPKFNGNDGVDLLVNKLANNQSILTDPTIVDFQEVGELSIDPNQSTLHSQQQPLSSASTECAGPVTSSVQVPSQPSPQLSITSVQPPTSTIDTAASTTNTSNELLCFVCGMKFPNRDSWEDHSLTSHAKGFYQLRHSICHPATTVVLDHECYITYRCYLCHHRYDNRHKCELHMIRQHNQQATEINWGMLTENSSDLTTRKTKTTINSSRVCETTLPTQRLKLSDYPEDPFVCALCSFQCSTRALMAQHGTTLHQLSATSPANLSPSFQCPDCSLTFSTSKSRNIHLVFIHHVLPHDPVIKQYLN